MALAARLEAERLAAEQARLTAKLAALESPAAAAPTLVRLSDKRNVMFEFTSAVLTPAAQQELDKVLGMIREFDQIDGIEIVGHTDSSGPDSYNQTLSERRAASVKQLLESRGVGSSAVSVRGEGESNPVSDNGTRDGRAGGHSRRGTRQLPGLLVSPGKSSYRLSGILIACGWLTLGCAVIQGWNDLRGTQKRISYYHVIV